MATRKAAPAAHLTLDEEAPDRWSMTDALILAALVAGIAMMTAGVWCDPLFPITALIG